MKAQGNSHFTSKPPSHATAVEAYKSALALLPPCPRKEATPQIKPEHVGSVIEEVTDEQAEEIIAAEQAKEHPGAEQQERDRLEEDIRECIKACWSNLAACHLATVRGWAGDRADMQGDDKGAVEACTEALKVDPHHVKALQRRATANERISTWSSLTSAKEGKCCVIDTLTAQTTSCSSSCFRHPHKPLESAVRLPRSLLAYRCSRTRRKMR